MGEDQTGTQFASLLTSIMQLSPADDFTHNLLIRGTIPFGCRRPDLPLICSEPQTGTAVDLICDVLPAENTIDIADQLMELGLIIASGSEARGGILLHGALAVKNGLGIIMAGPGNVGKTTASRRLPESWQSLSDDCTLVVRNESGGFQAHPWPTWNAFLAGNFGQQWPVQTCAPLQALFLLKQHHEDSLEKLMPITAAGMVNEIAEQCWYGLDTDFPRDLLCMIRIRRFHNICRLAGSIPCYFLRLAKDGAFWRKIERVLGLDLSPSMLS